MRSQLLATSHAFHSAMMDPAAEVLVAAARAIPFAVPRLPFVSNVTGAWIEPEAAVDSCYWGRQLRRTVRFADGLQELYRSSDYILLEVGPGRTLANLARQHPDADGRQPIFSSMPRPAEGSSDLESLVSTLGNLWLQGVEPDWSSFHADESCRRVPLPCYPFEHQRYWIGPAADERNGVGEEYSADWNGEPTALFSYPAWTPAFAAPSGRRSPARCRPAGWFSRTSRSSVALSCRNYAMRDATSSRLSPARRSCRSTRRRTRSGRTASQTTASC